MAEARKPRDLGLVDAVDAYPRSAFSGEVWRVARAGRDPVQASPSIGRWSDGRFDVLYTALERDGAVAEIAALLASQPVFPSKIQWWAHRLAVSTQCVLRVAEISELQTLGIDTARYRERVYDRTQSIADAAYFLGFDGLIAPNARWDCANLVLFTERVLRSDIVIVETEAIPVDWAAWHGRRR